MPERSDREVPRPLEPGAAEPWWLLGPADAGRVAVWGVFFLLLAYLPLRGADFWGHVAYGRWILESGELPREDPFLPLAEGMEVVDGAWLSQVLLAAVEGRAGTEGLAGLFALAVLLTWLLLARAFLLASGSGRAAGLGVLAALGIGWSRIASLRPETFGALAFAALLWILTGDRGPRLRRWLGVPVVMALWANLDPSFAAGIALLACRALGAAAEVAWRERSPIAPLADPAVRRRVWLAELGLAATLANPYGLDLWLHGLSRAATPRLAGVAGAEPLTLGGPGGVELALALVALFAVARFSRRRLPAADVLAVAAFAVAAALRADLVGWLAPVVALVLVPHLPAVFKKRRAESGGEPIRSWRWTLAAALLAWIVFALSPLAAPVLGGGARPPEALLDRTSPAEVADYLWREPPAGQLFHPAAWGDWLVLEGKPGLRPFAGADPRRVPRRVWTDYRSVAGARGDWQRLLARYRVATVVVDRVGQPALARALRASPDWRRVHHDPQALVFVAAGGSEAAP